MNVYEDAAIIAWCTCDSDLRYAKNLINAFGYRASSLVLTRDQGAYAVSNSRNCITEASRFATIPEAWEWLKSNVPDKHVFVEAKFNHANLPEGSLVRFLNRSASITPSKDVVCNYSFFTDAYLTYSPNRRSAWEIGEGFLFIGPSTEEICYFLQNEESNEWKSPSVISLDLSPQCNKQCEKCLFHSLKSPYRNYIPKHEQMPFEMAVELIHQAAEFEPKPVIAPTFSGEPLLYPRLLELLRIAKELELQVSITTNAMLLKPAVVDDLLDMKVDTIMISLDAASPETYSKLQPPGSFDSVIANIRRLLEARRGGTSTVGMTFVAEEENEVEFEEFLRIWKDADYIVKSHKLDMVQNGKPLLSRNAKAPLNAPCSASLRGLYIRYDGRIALCGYDLEHDNVGLQAGKGMSLKQLWSSDKLSNLRRKMLNPPYTYPFCKACACREGQFLWDTFEDGLKVTISPITKTYRPQGTITDGPGI